MSKHKAAGVTSSARNLSLWLGCCALALAPGWAQTSLALSSATAASGSSVLLTLSLNAAPGQAPSALQWTLNFPASQVLSFAVADGPAAAASGKTVSCSGNTCVLLGVNSQSLAGGIAANLTLQLSPNAAGNLAIQLSNVIAASYTGDSMPILSSDGVVSVKNAGPAGVSISPAQVSLGAAQTQLFSAVVTGTANTGVTWNLSPPLGAVVPGAANTAVYTAPGAVDTPRTVTLSATSLADPSKSASARISLQPSAPQPSISVAIDPSSITLSGYQVQPFVATVTGAAQTGVTWSLNPALGQLFPNGLYIAPGPTDIAQTVQITATSVTDPSRSATALVTIGPHIGIALSPGPVSLSANASQQFAARVSGSSETGVVWSIYPAQGAITQTGLYTAPEHIDQPGVVGITAASVADPNIKTTTIVILIP